MKVVFRANASATVGLGHLARCRTLAQALNARGFEVEFIGSEDAGWVDRPGSVDWLVVDHYLVDADWEFAARKRARKIMVIDDLAREHNCDLLLDQNLLPSLEDRYVGKVPRACHCLLGPQYVLLRSEFARARQLAAPRVRAIRSILVTLGGADAKNETLKIVRALKTAAPEITVSVLVGALNPNFESIRQEIGSSCRFQLLSHVDNMAERLIGSDLVIGAVGGSTWERFCLGVPSLLVTIAPNQEEIARHLATLNLIRFLGADDDLDAEDYRDAIEKACCDPAPLVAMASRASTVVDGLGATRVAQAILDHC